jgi:uncharacterized membrane protein
MNTQILHPMIVHFPIALILTGFLADTISLFIKKENCLSKVGLYLMVLGTLGAIAAVITGEYFTNKVEGDALPLKEVHELFGKITMFILIAASVFRIFLVMKKKDEGSLKWIVYFLFLLAVIAIAITGYKGGSIVYDVWLSAN